MIIFIRPVQTRVTDDLASRIAPFGALFRKPGCITLRLGIMDVI
jgi:hypothetical protein